MRTVTEIETGLREEMAAARVFADMGYVPSKPATVTNRDGDTFERGLRGLTLIHADGCEAIDRAMRERGHLLHEQYLREPKELPLVMGGQAMTDAEMKSQGNIVLGVIAAVIGIACLVVVAGMTGGGA